MRKFLFLAAIAAVTLASCGAPRQLSTAEREQQQQEVVQDNLLTTSPVPQLTLSVERQQLIRRAERLNTENLNGCITLFVQGLGVVGQFNVDGKPSSLNSFLTGGERLVRMRPQGSSYMTDGSSTATGAYSDVLVESPDVDGAYGENVDGIFFFEAGTNAYIEWRGDYFYSDQCLTTSQRPILVRQPS